MSRHRAQQQHRTPRPARTGRSRVYLALGVALFAIAALTIGGYFAQSPPPPAPPAALGTIPAAMTNPAGTPRPRSATHRPTPTSRPAPWRLHQPRRRSA